MTGSSDDRTDRIEYLPSSALYPHSQMPRATFVAPPLQSSKLMETFNDIKGGWTIFTGLVESAVHLPKLCLIGYIIGIVLGLLYPQSRSLDELNDLRESSVLITGASMGIGEHMAYIFASKGAKLFLTARSQPRLRDVVNRCKRLGASTVFSEVANMANSSSIDELVKSVAGKFHNRLDFLIMNHALDKGASPWHGSVDDVSDLRMFFEVNFVSYAHLASALMPSLKLSRGRIVAVSSISGRLPFPHLLIYSVSKSAVDSFFSGLRQELNIRREKISVSVAVLGLAVSSGGGRINDTVAPIFTQDSFNETAECVIFGAYDRSKVIFCPPWLYYPFSLFLDVPIIRPVLEKYVAYFSEKRYGN